MTAFGWVGGADGVPVGLWFAAVASCERTTTQAPSLTAVLVVSTVWVNFVAVV